MERDEANFSRCRVTRSRSEHQELDKTDKEFPAEQRIVLPDSSNNFRGVITTRSLAQIAVFSGLIAFGTAILSTSFLAIPIPPPLYEITAAPAFYFAISVLYSRKV